MSSFWCLLALGLRALTTLNKLRCWEVSRVKCMPQVGAEDVSAWQSRPPDLRCGGVRQCTGSQVAVVGLGSRTKRVPSLPAPHRLSRGPEQPAQPAVLALWPPEWGEPDLAQRGATPNVKEALSADLARRGDLGRCCVEA